MNLTLVKGFVTLTLISSLFSFEVAGQNEPTMDPVSDVNIPENAGEQTVGLTGISDNSFDFQTVTIDPVSGDESIIPNSSISIENYSPPFDATADLKFTPAVGQSGTVTITITLEDDNGTTVYDFDVIINGTPTDISLDNASIDENQSSGSLVGTFTTTDPDVGDSHTYFLVGGTGDDDNGSFQISGSSLMSDEVFDFESKTSYSIRVQTMDNGTGDLTFEKTFTITINDANDAPSDITLSDNSVDENQSSGSTVGSLSTVDQDAGDSHIYSLVGGTGDDDNGSFQINGDQLQTAAVFDHEGEDTYSVRIRTTDNSSSIFEKVFTINVNDVNEAPTNITLTDNTIDEGQPSGTVVGTLSTSDQDAGDSHTYSLVGTGNDNGNFQIVGDELRSDAVFNYDVKNSFSVRVRTTDNNSLTFEKDFTINVNDVNNAPTDITLSNNSIDENQPSGTLVGTLSTTDQDGGDTHTYSLVTGTGSTGNSSFQIVNDDELHSTVVFDHESQPSYSIRVETADDGTGNLTFEKVFTISINNINEPPTASDNSITGNEDEDYDDFEENDFAQNFSDVDGDVFDGIKVISLPNEGILKVSGSAVQADDELSLNDIANLTYTPEADEFDSPYTTFDFQVKDDQGLYSTETYTLTINIDPLNDAPTASNESVIVDEDVPYDFKQEDFDGNYDDTESDAFDGIKVTSNVDQGTLQYNGGDPVGQEIGIGGFNNLTFVSDQDDNGASYTTFTFQVKDDQGAYSSDYTMTINVDPVPDNPTSANDEIEMDENETHTFSATDFTFDDADDDLFDGIKVITTVDKGDFVYNNSTPVTDNVVISDVSLLTFSPEEDENGEPYTTFTFKVIDDSGAESDNVYTMTIDVGAVNEPPTGSNESIALDEDGDYTFGSDDFTFNDTDGHTFAGIRVETPPVKGKLTYNGSDITSTTDCPDVTQLVFVPAANGFGSPYTEFTFKIIDSSGERSSSTYTMTIDVDPINDQPKLDAIADPAAINEDAGTQQINLTGISPGDGESQAVVITATSNNTSLISNGNISIDYTDPATTGTLSYSASNNAFGTATITVTVDDQQGESNSTVTRSFDVQVNPVADTPNVTDASTDEGEQTTSGLVISRNDNDGSEVSHFKITSITNGALYRNNGNTQINNGDFITYNQGNAGLKFTPDSKADGSFMVQASTSNNDAGLGGNQVKANIIVNAVPTTTGIADVTKDEDADDFSISLVDAFDDDEDADVDLDFTIQANSNSALFNGLNISGTSSVTSGTSLDVSLEDDENGSSNITIRATDTQGAFVETTFTITVNPVNDPPGFTLSQSLVSKNEDFSETVTITVNEAPVPADEQSQTVTYSIEPSSVDFVDIQINSSTGEITINSVPNESGSETFDVVADDGETLNGTVTRQLSVNIGAVNNPPVFTINTDNIDVEEDFENTINVDVTPEPVPDDEQDQEVIYSLSPSSVGFADVSINENTGDVTINAVPDRNGTQLFTITANDGESQNNIHTQSFTLSVDPVNDPPTIDPVANISLPEGAGEQNITLTGLTPGPFERSEGQTILAIIPSSGSIDNIPTPSVDFTEPDEEATLTFTPEPDASGYTILSVLVLDDEGKGTTETFVVTIDDQNDAPEFDMISTPITIDEDAGEQTINVTGINAGPGESQVLSLSASSADEGLIQTPLINYTSPSTTGTVRFTPVKDANGSTMLTITLTDNGPGDPPNENSYSQDIDVIVNPVNDPPQFTNIPLDVIQATTDEEFHFDVTAKDPDEADNLAITVINKPEWLTFTDNGDGTAVLVGVPDSGDVGTYNVEIKVADDNNTEDTETFTINVIHPNNIPEFTSEPDETAIEQVFYEYNMTASDDDEEDNLSFSVITKPNWLTFTDNGDRTAKLEGTPPVGSEGDYPVELEVSDDKGGNSQQAYTLTVSSFNAAPDVSNFQKTTQEDVALRFQTQWFKDNFDDPDGDTLVTVRISTLPQNGELTFSGASIAANDEISVNDIGKVVYTPDTDYEGFDDFNWNGSDGDKYASSNAKVNVNVVGENDPPVLTITRSSVEYPFGADSLILDDGIGVSNDGNTQLKSVKVWIDENQYEKGYDSLGFNEMHNIEGTFNADSGSLVLQGIVGAAQYQEALRTLKFVNIRKLSPRTHDRTVFIQLIDGDGELKSNIETITVEFEEDFIQPSIPTGFTPNNDIANDTWELKVQQNDSIYDITRLYPEVQVMVYNRGGKLVYESRGYDRPWDGTSQNGNPLPGGVYYYYVDLNKFKATLKGTVTILK